MPEHRGSAPPPTRLSDRKPLAGDALDAGTDGVRRRTQIVTRRGPIEATAASLIYASSLQRRRLIDCARGGVTDELVGLRRRAHLERLQRGLTVRLRRRQADTDSHDVDDPRRFL